MRPCLCEDGSVLLFVLFVCLAVAVLVTTLTAVVLCADGSMQSEKSGRLAMEQKTLALAWLRERLLTDWRTTTWSAVDNLPGTEAAVNDLADSGGQALAVSARQPGVSPLSISAWAERGRDGLDLPLAGLVAEEARWAPGRSAPWLCIEAGDVAADGGASAPPVARLRVPPVDPLLGPGVEVAGLSAAWRLDGVWQGFFEQVAAQQEARWVAGGHVVGEGLAPGPDVRVVDCGRGTAHIPEGWGVSPTEPGLLVATGVGVLDASGRGELYGVIVANGGDVLLEATTLHGALFVSGRVDLGVTGAVCFSRSVLRWATDRSLVRTRLVPGTRSESPG